MYFRLCRVAATCVCQFSLTCVSPAKITRRLVVFDCCLDLFRCCAASQSKDQMQFHSVMLLTRMDQCSLRALNFPDRSVDKCTLLRICSETAISGRQLCVSQPRKSDTTLACGWWDSPPRASSIRDGIGSGASSNGCSGWY